MQRLMGLIAFGLTALTLGGGLLSAAWLLWLGEMRPVAAGLCLLLAGGFVTELAAVPARQLRQQASATRRALPALVAQIWIFLAMSGWAVSTLALYGVSAGAEAVPLLLWCYAVAVSPWLLFERRHFVRTGRYFLCSTPPSPLLFFEIACAAAAAQLLLSSNPQLVAASFVAIMAISLLFECAEAAFPARVREIWVASREPGARRSSPWAAAALVIGMAGLFAIDVATPAGIDDGAGYSPLLILCLWLAGRRALLVTACISSVLVVTAFFLVQSTAEIGLVGTLFNRTMSVASIWIVYLFLSRRSLLAAALRAAEGRLRTAS